MEILNAVANEDVHLRIIKGKYQLATEIKKKGFRGTLKALHISKYSLQASE